MLENTTKFAGERYEVGMLWSEPERQTYRTTTAQPWVSFTHWSVDSKPEKFVSTVNKYRCRKGIREDIGRVRCERHLRKRIVFATYPVLNPNKPGKVRRVCNAASKYKEVCLNDKLLAGPDLLHGLIGTIFRLREGPIALTADIESMFLQVQVPEQDRSCLRFLWRPRTNEPVQIYKYQRHVFGAKSSRTCANYALKRVGLDNE